MSNQQVFAYMNHGRWLYRCPRCNTVLPVTRDICPIDYPNANAKMLQQVTPGKFRPIPDLELREQAHAQAAEDGQLYEPLYPENRAQIERVLRERKRENMNWLPGESLDLLIADNIEHGDPLPKEMSDGL